MSASVSVSESERKRSMGAPYWDWMIEASAGLRRSRTMVLKRVGEGSACWGRVRMKSGFTN